MAGADALDARAETFFDAAAARFDAWALASESAIVQHIALGGRIVRLEVSAGAMARAILPALAHLAVPAVPAPDLTVRAWDSESTGIAPISPGWGPDAYRREGYISGFNDGGFHTALQFGPLILRMLDGTRRRALYWTPSAARLPHWERGAPMRPLLHEWLKRSGFVAVHGGAVGTAEGGVFLAGAGGRGKSNVALSCLVSDLRYASDDFCFLSQRPEWTVHSLYCTGKIAAGDRARHPHLHGAESNPERLDHEKALFFLNERFGDRLIRRMPLRAIVLPHVVGHGPGTVVPMPPGDAHRAIATSTIELSRWTGGDTLRSVATLLGERPCYELRVGARIGEVPDLLARLLSDLRPEPPPPAPR